MRWGTTPVSVLSPAVSGLIRLMECQRKPSGTFAARPSWRVVFAPVLVQLGRSPNREDRERLLELGVTRRDYVPQLSYIERLTDKQLEVVRADDLVRAVVPYVAAFKLDPDIGRRDFVTEERRQAGPLLLVVGFPGEPVGELQEALERLDLRIQSSNVEEVDGSSRFIVRPAELALAANIVEIAAVKSVEEIGDVTLNNGTTSWVHSEQCHRLPSDVDRGRPRRGTDRRPLDSALDSTTASSRTPLTTRPSRPPEGRGLSGTPHGRSLRAARHVLGGHRGREDSTPMPFGGAEANNGNAPGAARLTYLIDLDCHSRAATDFFDYLLAAASDGACDSHEQLARRSRNANPVQPDRGRRRHVHLEQRGPPRVLGSAGNTGEERAARHREERDLRLGHPRRDPNEMNFGDGNTGPTPTADASRT